MTVETVKGDDSSKSSSSVSVRKGFSHFTAVCFTINYLIGTGFLTLPWAFQQGGTLLSTIALVFVVFISNISKNYVLESMARAEAMIGFSVDELDGTESEVVSLTRKEIKQSDSEYGSTEGASDEECSAEETPQESKPLSYMEPFSIAARQDTKYEVKERKFEYVELCRIFLGVKGEIAYITAISVSICAQLWGYTSVFSSAMATTVPIQKDFGHDYTVYTLIFGSIVVPLSCLDLKEQVQFQLFLTLCRFIVIGLMVLTTFVACVEGLTGVEGNKPVYFVGTDGPVGANWIDFSGFYEMFSVLVYSAMFHNAIPVLSEPVADKRTLNTIFRDAFIVCGGAFWVIGYIIAWYFGDHIEQSANLNWEYFVGGTGRPSSNGSGDWVDVATW
eukprot:CAMPEP_0197442940 /NCGR_PEP_ID=MMETSP1175-20131217/8826_1 /TAXON_ID=1003142 /ORGANISM="Triceratium dubium, Strain CCMP147" /LENGTH=388 /DNA_ID=CAMNT_0042973505 /DNA_START=374 /DNA_END=1537 /DNA_ORIENTATION=+